MSVASVETSAPATTADLSSAATTPEPEGRAVVASVVPNAPPLNGLTISAAQATPSAANMAVATDVVDSAGPGRIVIEALAPAWVRLRRPDGDVLLSKVMGRGEKFTIPDHPEVLLSTGDAGSVWRSLSTAPASPTWVAPVKSGRCDLGRGSFGGGQRR